MATTKSTEEHQANPSFPQQEEQSDATEGEVIVDYGPDVEYKPEESDPEIKQVDEAEAKLNSDANYAKL